METVIIIALIIFFFVYLMAQDSKKETKKERYGEAIGDLASMAADSIAAASFKLTEPASKKKVRLAKEALAMRNGFIYRIAVWDSSAEETLKRLLIVDDAFKSDLELLGLTKERWQKMALDIYYIGVIMQLSRDSFDYSQKKDEWRREHLFSEKNKHGKEEMAKLADALLHFNIPVQEWIDFGETVLDMHCIYDEDDIKKFGYKSSIKAMPNNFHVL